MSTTRIEADLRAHGDQARTPKLRIVSIPGVAPLDDGFSTDPKKTVPDALAGPLFAAMPDGTQPACFAVLDAARFPNLPQILETSGLRHRCLFTGDAQEELQDAAPWLVELDRDHHVLRCLFTRGDAYWHVWDSAPGIFLRGHAGFDALWKHLRRFTRVRDAAGKWYLLRFWEPQAMATYLRAIAEDAERIAQWFASADRALERIIACDPHDGSATLCDAPAPDHPGRDRRAVAAFRLDSREIEAFRHYKWARFLRQLSAFLATQSPAFARLDPSQQMARSHALASRAYACGLQIEKAVADFCHAAEIAPGGARIETDPGIRRILSGDAHQIDKARDVLATVQNHLAKAQQERR